VGTVTSAQNQQDETLPAQIPDDGITGQPCSTKSPTSLRLYPPYSPTNVCVLPPTSMPPTNTTLTSNSPAFIHKPMWGRPLPRPANFPSAAQLSRFTKRTILEDIQSADWLSASHGMMPSPAPRSDWPGRPSYKDHVYTNQSSSEGSPSAGLSPSPASQRMRCVHFYQNSSYPTPTAHNMHSLIFLTPTDRPRSPTPVSGELNQALPLSVTSRASPHSSSLRSDTFPANPLYARKPYPPSRL
jgi:hypothetical protein